MNWLLVTIPVIILITITLVVRSRISKLRGTKADALIETPRNPMTDAELEKLLRRLGCAQSIQQNTTLLHLFHRGTLPEWVTSAEQCTVDRLWGGIIRRRGESQRQA